MIRLCPHCGHTLSQILTDGLSTCENCNQFFDSSLYYQALSAAWVVRKWHIDDIEQLRWKFNFCEEALKLVDTHVIDQGCCHDDFLKIIRSELPVDGAA